MGELLTVPDGSKLYSEFGESSLSERNVFHKFYAEKGRDVMIGDVSAVNDDHQDNICYSGQVRFPAMGGRSILIAGQRLQQT